MIKLLLVIAALYLPLALLYAVSRKYAPSERVASKVKAAPEKGPVSEKEFPAEICPAGRNWFLISGSKLTN